MFRKASDEIGQPYTYKKPSNPQELIDIINDISPEIVVLDTHGNYQKMLDDLLVYMGNKPVKVSDFIPNTIVPPVWILSACEMSVVGSLRGSIVGPLLERGAISVIATLHEISADAASLFVGRLLTEIYSPPVNVNHKTLSEAFFTSQLTSALLYDPLFPLLRKSKRKTELREKLSYVFLEYLKYFDSKPIDSRQFRYKASEILSECLIKYGLYYEQLETVKAGQVVPETLFFSAFGVPSRVKLIGGSSNDTVLNV